MDLHSVFFVVWKEFEARVCTSASCCNDFSTVPSGRPRGFVAIGFGWSVGGQCNALPMGILETLFSMYSCKNSVTHWMSLRYRWYNGIS